MRGRCAEPVGWVTGISRNGLHLLRCRSSLRRRLASRSAAHRSRLTSLTLAAVATVFTERNKTSCCYAVLFRASALATASAPHESFARRADACARRLLAALGVDLRASCPTFDPAIVATRRIMRRTSYSSCLPAACSQTVRGQFSLAALVRHSLRSHSRSLGAVRTTHMAASCRRLRWHPAIARRFAPVQVLDTKMSSYRPSFSYFGLETTPFPFDRSLIVLTRLIVSLK